MKNLTNIIGAVLLFAAVALPSQVNAQLFKPTYFNIDWQFNAPVGNDYADCASGWGMSFEGGYYVIPKLAIGLYGSFHTNNKYVEPQVLHLSSTSSLYTDQQHSLFQIPFGALVKYRFIEDGQWEPYVTMKLGAQYASMDSYTSVVTFYDDTWGFNMQPEVGLSFYPSVRSRFGIHLAIYYNFSTNKSQNLIYEIDTYSNIGFHLGVSF